MQPGLYLITGPNGSGKSQRARTLAERTEGAQLLSPESQQAFYEAELARDDSDFHGGADPGHTVRQLLGPEGAAHPLCSTFRLTPLLDHGYRTLSTGESRKALILRALVQRPTLLVLDEPFEGLAPVIVEEIQRILHEIRDLGITSIIVEQNAVAALELSDQAIILDMGEVVFRGEARQVLLDADLRHEYLAI